ncbi:hypothetical protein SASPL_142746 [Salvia splendens]|uniref:Cytidyltransferase-like domain-containing protein n=1 Tax=Salvia splendens TaxID=180675 RepID=A0A8X8WKA7_SALSN|nr:hypothetical protein SASPL_142746 [Salvia splendens]
MLNRFITMKEEEKRSPKQLRPYLASEDESEDLYWEMMSSFSHNSSLRRVDRYSKTGSAPEMKAIREACSIRSRSGTDSLVSENEFSHTHSSRYASFTNEMREQEEKMSDLPRLEAQMEHSFDNAKDFNYSSKNEMVEEHSDNPGSSFFMASRLEIEVDAVGDHGASNLDVAGVTNQSIALRCDKHGVEEDQDASPESPRVSSLDDITPTPLPVVAFLRTCNPVVQEYIRKNLVDDTLAIRDSLIMDASARALVEAIHATPTQAVLHFAGGGSQALGWLMSVPGASNTVLEAVVPFSSSEKVFFLRCLKVPTQFASRQTAEDMALMAYNRAIVLYNPGFPALGVGFSGSLASSRPKLGDHRFHVSTRTSDQLWSSTVTLSKGMRTREQEDKVSSQFVLKAIAYACKVPTTFVSELTDSEVYPFSSDFSTAERKIILPGSFNPLHDGHLKLLEVAVNILGEGYPCFELSAVNADKPPLTVSEIKRRVMQFEKVGEPKYYSGDYGRMLETLLGCKSTGCVFLVAGRNIDGKFKVVDDLDIPAELRDLFIPIPPEKFRMDISSTQIRKTQGML